MMDGAYQNSERYWTDPLHSTKDQREVERVAKMSDAERLARAILLLHDREPGPWGRFHDHMWRALTGNTELLPGDRRALVPLAKRVLST